MKQLVFIAFFFPILGLAQKTHAFSFSGSYGLSFIQFKSFDQFVESFNAYQPEIVSPLEKFSHGRNFDFMLSIPFKKKMGVHLGYTYTTASTSATYSNNRGRTFDYTRKGFHLGFDLHSKHVGTENKCWVTFSNSLFYGWQDITTAYQYYPGFDYHGGQQKQLNGQFYIGALFFQTDLSISYKIKNVSLFVKGGVNFPSLLNQQFHNLERAQTYSNFTYLPTDIAAYYADPIAYDFDAIDNPDMQVSARNWIYTCSLGLSIHFVDKSETKDKK